MTISDQGPKNPPVPDPASADSDPYANIPDAELYRSITSEWPFFSPWLSPAFQAFCQDSVPYTLVSPQPMWILYSLAQQAMALPGEFVECGVYKGGTALLLARVIREHAGPQKKVLHLFDTFEGMPDTDPEKDMVRKGDFSDTSLEDVRARLAGFPSPIFHQGKVPETLKSISGARICFAHIDVDLYQSVFDCCEVLYPQMVPGGIMVFDDYGFQSCPGARAAVDTWFKTKPEVPLVLPTAQAIVTKLPSSAQGGT